MEFPKHFKIEREIETCCLTDFFNFPYKVIVRKILPKVVKQPTELGI